MSKIKFVLSGDQTNHKPYRNMIGYIDGSNNRQLIVNDLFLTSNNRIYGSFDNYVYCGNNSKITLIEFTNDVFKKHFKYEHKSGIYRMVKGFNENESNGVKFTVFEA